jgi:hypothetical protein
MTSCRSRAARNSRAEKPPSATSTNGRPGIQRRACRTSCRPQSVSFLRRSPRSRQYRSEGARAVKNGSAQTRPAQGTGTSSIKPSQRSPLALTKCPWLERTGSR